MIYFQDAPPARWRWGVGVVAITFRIFFHILDTTGAIRGSILASVSRVMYFPFVRFADTSVLEFKRVVYLRRYNVSTCTRITPTIRFKTNP